MFTIIRNVLIVLLCLIPLVSLVFFDLGKRLFVPCAFGTADHEYRDWVYDREAPNAPICRWRQCAKCGQIIEEGTHDFIQSPKDGQCGKHYVVICVSCSYSLQGTFEHDYDREGTCRICGHKR